MDGYTAQSILSKKRYYEIETVCHNILGDDALTAQIMSSIQNIMKFDPNASTYTKERGQKNIEFRKKKAEELGVTTYITSGGKKLYDKRKGPQKTI